MAIHRKGGDREEGSTMVVDIYVCMCVCVCVYIYIRAALTEGDQLMSSPPV